MIKKVNKINKNEFYKKKQTNSAFFAYSNRKIQKPTRKSFGNALTNHQKQQSSAVRSSLLHNTQKQEEKTNKNVSAINKNVHNMSVDPEAINRGSFINSDNHISSTPLPKKQKMKKQIKQDSIHEESYSFSDDIDFNLDDSDDDEDHKIQPIRFFEIAQSRKSLKSKSKQFSGHHENNKKDTLEKIIEEAEGKPEIPNKTTLGASHSIRIPAFPATSTIKRNNVKNISLLKISCKKEEEEAPYTDRPSNKDKPKSQNSSPRTRNSKNYQSQRGNNKKKNNSKYLNPCLRNVILLNYYNI